MYYKDLSPYQKKKRNLWEAIHVEQLTGSNSTGGKGNSTGGRGNSTGELCRITSLLIAVAQQCG